MAPEQANIVAENFQFNNIFDSTAAKRDLNFNYTISWVEGVRRMVAWFEAHGGLPNSDNDAFEDRLVATWRRLEEQLQDALNS